jgi:TonB family protein
MNAPLSRYLSLSVAAHVVIVTIAVLSAVIFVPVNHPSIESKVFTLVSDRTAGEKPTARANDLATAMIRLPAIARPLVTASPLPRPPAQPVVTQAPSTMPAKEPALVTSPRMRIDEFRTLHPSPRVPEHVRPQAAPRIVVDAFDNSSASPSAHSSPGGSTDEKSAFIAGLVQRLRNAAGVIGQDGAGLACRIEITLSSNGSVQSSRILTSSGNRSFDQAVLAALKQIKPATPPAFLAGTPLRMTFQTVPSR